LADLAQIGVDICPADPARRLRGPHVGHDRDDRAEPLTMERMTLIVEVNGRMPADRVDSPQDVNDLGGVDAARLIEVDRAHRAEDWNHAGDDLGDLLSGERL